MKRTATIRQANNSDIENLLKIKTDSIARDEIENRLKKQEDGSANYYIIVDNDILIGHILLNWKGKPTHPEYPDIVDAFVDDSKRGKGYGTLLLKHCEDVAKAKGFTKIGLAVNPDLNLDAKRLYDRMGYLHDGKQKYLDGIYNGIEDWVIDMEKDI